MARTGALIRVSPLILFSAGCLMTLSISDSAAAVSDADLAAVERRLGVDFPDDYRAFLLRHNGGVPRPDRFRISREAVDPRMEWGRVTRFYSIGAGPGLGRQEG